MWAIKKVLSHLKIHSKNDLEKAVMSIWDAFPQDPIDRLVLPFQSRVKLVFSKNGNSISDELRSGADVSAFVPPNESEKNRKPCVGRRKCPFRGDSGSWHRLLCKNYGSRAARSFSKRKMVWNRVFPICDLIIRQEKNIEQLKRKFSTKKKSFIVHEYERVVNEIINWIQKPKWVNNSNFQLENFNWKLNYRRSQNYIQVFERDLL